MIQLAVGSEQLAVETGDECSRLAGLAGVGAVRLCTEPELSGFAALRGNALFLSGGVSRPLRFRFRASFFAL